MKTNQVQKTYSEWRAVKLDALSLKISDGIHTTPKYSDSGNYYFINGNNLNNSKVKFSDDTKKVNYSEYLKYKKDLNKEDTILLSINGTVGSVAYYNNEQVVLGKSCAYIRLKSNINIRFIFYYLNSYNTQKYFISELTGSTIQNLSIKSIKSVPVNFPPIPEQKRIVAVLETWDKAIEKLMKKIEAKTKIKKGLMQNLLTGKKRLIGFNKKWEIVKLSDISINLDNKRVPLNSEDRNKRRGNIPYCGANGVVDYIDDYIFNEDIILVAEDGGQFNEYKTRPIAYRMKGKCWVNNHAHVLKAKKEFSQDLLFYLTVHKDILQYLNGGTRAKLNKSELLKIKYYISTDNEEQRAIANILTTIDNEINKLDHKLSLFKVQKKYLLNNLITGKIRTPVNMANSPQLEFISTKV